MADNKQVVFRRINGRVVPIKVKKDQTSGAAAGAALAAAGIGVSASSGKAYRAVNRVATAKSVKAMGTLERIQTMSFRKTGQRQLSFDSLVRKRRAKELAYKGLKAGQRIGRFAAPLRIGGQIVGAAMVGAGVSKFLDSIKDNSMTKEKISAIAGATAVGAFITGSHGGAGFRRSIKPIYKKAYPHIRRMKGILKL